MCREAPPLKNLLKNFHKMNEKLQSIIDKYDELRELSISPEVI
jgi:hypothetical protein